MFGYEDQPNFPPRYNIAPTQPIALVSLEHGARRFMLARWGLIPGWVKDPAGFTLLINARAETAAEKPAFRGAMRHRRVIIPASGFYEWRRGDGGGKRAYWIRPRDRGIVGLAGLMETYMSADGSEIDTAAILTVEANRLVAMIHDRMPAVLSPDQFEAWLDVRGREPREVQGLLRPAANDLFEAIAVSDRVNTVRNDDEGLQQPADAATDRPAPTRKGRAGGPGSDTAGGGQMSLF